MTWEEAFKRLEQMYDFYAHAMDADKNYPLKGDAEAIKVALWAMVQDRGSHITREQVEKMRGEWRFPIFAEQDENDPRCQCSECESIETPLARHRFCPSCGSPMTDKAVDILWKRLEGNLNV